MRHSYETPGRPLHKLYDYTKSYHQRDPLGTLRSEYIPSPPPLPLPGGLECVYSTLLCYRISHDRRYIDRMMAT